MSSALTSVIIIAVFFVIIGRSLKKASKDTARTKTVRGAVPPRQPVPVPKPRVPKYSNYKPNHKDITSVSRDMGDSKGSSVLRDDRNNDWLARQLREEHRAFKETSEMFDLKIEHASHCDARFIEQFHRRNCDAKGIDLANGKTVNLR